MKGEMGGAPSVPTEERNSGEKKKACSRRGKERRDIIMEKGVGHFRGTASISRKTEKGGTRHVTKKKIRAKRKETDLG